MKKALLFLMAIAAFHFNHAAGISNNGADGCTAIHAATPVTVISTGEPMFAGSGPDTNAPAMPDSQKCPIPYNLNASTITTSSAVLDWTSTYPFPAYDIEYGQSPFFQGSGTVISGVMNPYSLTGLLPGTSYSYYVRSECGGGTYSQWAGPAFFTTACASLSLPLLESFESPVFPPSCWSNIPLVLSYVWARSSSASGNGSGIGSAFANFYNQNLNPVYDLITPTFHADVCSVMPYLSFNYAYATYAGEVDEMDIYYSTDDGTTWALLLAMPGGTSGILNTGGTVTSSFVPGPSQWGYSMIYLPAGTNKLKFRAISAYGNNLYLDNISIQSSETARDVEALSIDMGQVVPLGTIIPKATVRNNGFFPQTLDVTMAIGSYYSTETVVDLAPGASQQVSFDPCANSAGDYSATVFAHSMCRDINPLNDAVYGTIKVMELDRTVYGWTTFSTSSSGPVSFNLNDPGTLTELVNEYPVTSCPTAGAWANDAWYAAINNTAAPWNLVTFDTATGSRSLIGDLGVNISALSFNTANNTMYGIGYDGVNSQLYSIITATAGITFIGTITSRSIGSLAIDSIGVAYTIDQNDDVLGTINLLDAVFTPIGSIGFDANDDQDLEFDHETGELFLAAYSTTGELRWVDKVTGNTLLIGQFHGGNKLTGFVIPYIAGKSLTVTCLLEGLYNGAGTMHKARNESGFEFPGSVADNINIELHDALDYSSVIYTRNNINLNTSGLCKATIPENINGSYYITISHRNSIETTSATPVSFAGGNITYDFSLAISQAYGNNMKPTQDGYYIIYAGDVNQDGILDSSDMTPVDNLSSTFGSGYITEDINGDAIIDSEDMTILDNNSNAYVFAVTP